MTNQASKKSDFQNKPFLLITGMHRSGTSFVARAFNLMGVYLGDISSLISHEWNYRDDNLRGHWENKELLELGEKTLRDNKGSWHEIPTEINISKEFGLKINQAIQNLLKHPSVASGYKDPRSVLCFDAWHTYLPQNTIIIGIFRHPLKVAASLKKRDNFTYDMSLKLWKEYNKRLLAILDKNKGFLIDFDWPRERLLSEIQKIGDKLGLVTDINLSDWYTNDLLHSTIEKNYPIDNETQELYTQLKNRSENNHSINLDKITHMNPELISSSLLKEIQAQGKEFKIINDANIQKIKTLTEKLQEYETVKEITDPIGKLLFIYFNRPDLQSSFPEVSIGNYDKIIEWASDVVSGRIIDSSLDTLKPFSHWYQLQIDKIKKTDELSLQVISLSKTIEEKEVVIKQMQDSLDKTNSRLEEREVVIKQMQDSLDKTNSRLEEREVVIKQMQDSLDKTNSRLEERDNYIRNVEGQFKEVKREKELLKNEMSTIQASFIYNSFRFVVSLIDKLFPNNSRRGELKRIGIESLRVIRQEGIKSYLKHINAKVKRGEFKVVGSIPQSVVLLPEQSVYSLWINSQKLNDVKIEILKNEIAQFHYKPKISIITPVYNTPIDILRETITSVLNQVYENWEFCICDDASTNYQIRDLIIDFANKDKRIKYIFSSKNQGISGASNEALRLATGEFAGLLDHDDVLTRDALFEVVKLLNTYPETDYVYSDEDKMDEKGIRMEPFFKPDWSPDLFYSMHYATHFSVIRKKIIDELGGFRSEFNGSQDYDLVARVTEITDKVYHIPKILYSWRKIAGSTAGSTEAKPYAYTAAKKLLREYLNRRKIKGDVLDGLFTGSYRIRYQITGNPLISIIIPNKNNQKILEDCIDSIKNKTTYQNYEIIIVDNDSTDEKTKNYLKTLPFKIINYKEKFNFSKINNLGVKNSNGEYIVFLNNDTTIITPDWLESLLEHAQRQEIGIVGAKLLYPDNTVQHAGTIVGFNGDAYNYGRFPATDHGYFGLANVIRNCSAVTAACMMIKKSLFERLGGFDENLAHSWQDVDLCLRVLDSGKRIVYTPYSQLYHVGGATRGELDLTPEEKYARSLFIKQHQEFIKKGDPYYNPNLLLHEPPYVLKIDPSIFRDPMQLLVGIYLERPDLQREMPEVKNGEFSRLINWAAKNGIKNDSAKPLLERFSDFYIMKSTSD